MVMEDPENIIRMIENFVTKAQIERKFSRTDLVKSKSYDEYKHDCLICKQPAAYPLRCKGCKIIVCKNCAQHWLKNKRRCPQKCR